MPRPPLSPRTIIQLVNAGGQTYLPGEPGLQERITRAFPDHLILAHERAVEAFAELQRGVIPSVLVLGIPARTEQVVMLAIEARRLFPSLPILVLTTSDDALLEFDGFDVMKTQKFADYPAIALGALLHGPHRTALAVAHGEGAITLSDVLLLHHLQKSTGTLRFGGRSRARVGLVEGLPVMARVGKEEGRSALSKLLLKTSLRRCIFDPEPPETCHFHFDLLEVSQLFTRPEGRQSLEEQIHDIEDIDLGLLEGLDSLHTLRSEPLLKPASTSDDTLHTVNVNHLYGQSPGSGHKEPVPNAKKKTLFLSMDLVRAAAERTKPTPRTPPHDDDPPCDD